MSMLPIKSYYKSSAVWLWARSVDTSKEVRHLFVCTILCVYPKLLSYIDVLYDIEIVKAKNIIANLVNIPKFFFRVH